MENERSSPRRVGFGAYDFDRDAGTLRKEGRIVKLAPMPAKLLSLLVDQPGELVTREAIQKALWSDGTFVDFEQGISFCIKRIRDVLGDDSANPRYVETVPRSGYRFVAEVTPLEAPAPARRRTFLPVAATVLLCFGVLAVGYRANNLKEDGRPRVSVLPFENLTGDPDVDWLRLGVSEMLLTELAESRGVEVSRGEAGTVVRGSYVRAGERIRIDAHIEDGRTKTVVGSERVEGVIETELLSMMEELSKRVRLRLEIAALGQDPDLAKMTTASVDAYRHYIEGLDRLQRGALMEAVSYFEEALRLDPEFATAMVSLAMTHGLLGTEVENGRWSGSPEWVNAHWERRRALTERALELSHRLSGRERSFIEGQNYRMQGDDARAVEAWERTIALYPEHLMARLSIASRYVTHQEYEGIIEQLEAIRTQSEAFRQGGTQDQSLEKQLAGSYAALGRLDEARSLLEEVVDRFPEDPKSHDALGQHLIMSGRLDEADVLFERARRLREDGRVPVGVAMVHVLRGDLDRAEEAAGDNLFYRAVIRLHRGRSEEGLEVLGSIAGYERLYVGWPAMYLSETLLQLDRPEEALELETPAVFRAMALARLGRVEDARSQAAPFRGARTRIARLLDHLLGFELAVALSDDAKALEELSRAERLLAPHGLVKDETPQHVPVWYRLARAHLRAGDTREAEKWLRKIVDSPSERLTWPIAYVRSLYWLGQIHESRGEVNRARELYGRFYRFWKDGDLDRDRIVYARKYTGP
jgi:DNA-binding winged helix-turn-helix (wHTH) protein/tetratricopeptide (TPR) repeat protein